MDEVFAQSPSFVFPLNLHSTFLSIGFVIINTHARYCRGQGQQLLPACCFPSAGWVPCGSFPGSQDPSDSYSITPHEQCCSPGAPQTYEHPTTTPERLSLSFLLSGKEHWELWSLHCCKQKFNMNYSGRRHTVGSKLGYRLWCGPFKEEAFLLWVPWDAGWELLKKLQSSWCVPLMRVEGEQEPAWGKAGRGLGRAGDEGATAALFDAEPAALITPKM